MVERLATTIDEGSATDTICNQTLGYLREQRSELLPPPLEDLEGPASAWFEEAEGLFSACDWMEENGVCRPAEDLGHSFAGVLPSSGQAPAWEREAGTPISSSPLPPRQAWTVIATTVHPSQILEDGTIPVADHDFPLDLIVSPDEVMRTETKLSRPQGIIEEQLDQSKREGIPVLRHH